MPLVLVLGLLGRGHVLQAMGWLPCSDDLMSAEAPKGHHDTDDASDTHEDCPADCHRCPCGQIPMMAAASAMPPLTIVLTFVDLETAAPRAIRGDAHAPRIDRPPRPLLAS